jgi:manganese transport protein
MADHSHESASEVSQEPEAGFFDRYGVAFVMVASVVGSGSIFIASTAGIQYGYTLIWGFVAATLIGLMAQDMSARLGIFGEPLATFVRRKFGQRIGTLLIGVLSIGAFLWIIELTAAAAKGFSVLIGGAIGWQPLAIVISLLAIGTGLLDYDRLEQAMLVTLFVLLGAYLLVAGASTPSIGGIASGFVPSLPGSGALALLASIVGSTAIWSNFFLESNLVEQKDWTSAADVSEMRKDLVLGFSIALLVIVAVLVVCAAVLRPAGYDQLQSFVTPGIALIKVLGQWAGILFLLGAATAAFNSIMPVMWAVVFMFMNVWGKDVQDTDRSFRLFYVGGTALGMLAPVISTVTGWSVVQMIVRFAAYSGIVSLPITAALLFWAVNDDEVMGEQTNGTILNVCNAVLVVLAFVLAALSLPSLLNMLLSGGL